jgi:thymidylate kinase
MCVKIIWINGAFGSGKTQTAFEINRRLENSFVYDPEHIGYFLRRNMPTEILDKNDFQNEILWRQFNYKIIKYIALKYSGIIIIPMTLYVIDYYEEIIEKLLLDKIIIDHYILGATKETIIKRLKKRGDGKNRWALDKIDKCIEGFEEIKSKYCCSYINTNNMNINAVVKLIEEKSNIKLLEERNPEIIKKIKKMLIQIKHIRIFR